MKLEFEFVRAAGVARWLYVLLFVSMSFVIFWYTQYHQSAEVFAGRTLRLQSLQPAPAEASSFVEMPETAGMSEAESVAQQLNMPWGKLMQELQILSDKDVSLLAVEPDVSARKIRISAEARTATAMFAFIRRGADLELMSELHLEQHRQVKEDPMQPVRFEVSAVW